ncbi:hypothetical protein M413DRAFT_29193 [Hebeloma cylindrosporum]|uniref:Uncharacterized protein n=1 Tax=Hebeloma cylindrosporum TaxID=76867 RepID=A0A0C2XP80_HEBCY|nr:hypothetical protein M413DRAFT_29193 [Hebeloma cylindrosporum h7]
MSQSSKGFISSVPGSLGSFGSSFYVKKSKILYNASGTFETTVPEFECYNATVKYDDIDDLTSTRSFAGRVGMNDIQLTFDNGPVISGRLDMPIDPATTVSGSAVWTEN